MLTGVYQKCLRCDDIVHRKTACFKNSAVTELVLGILVFCLIVSVGLIKLLQPGKLADHSGNLHWIIFGLGLSLSFSMIAVGSVKLCIARKNTKVGLDQV